MKWIVLTERPADGTPALLIMGVCEDTPRNANRVGKWVEKYPDRRGFVFTEYFEGFSSGPCSADETDYDATANAPSIGQFL